MARRQSVAKVTANVHGGGVMQLSTGELLVVGVVVLIIFSASRMGQLGNALGRFVYSFKKASQGGDLVDGQVARRFDRSKATDGEVLPPDGKS